MTGEDTSYLIQVLPRLFHKLGYNAQYFMVFPVPSAFPIPEKKNGGGLETSNEKRDHLKQEKRKWGEKKGLTTFGIPVHNTEPSYTIRI